MVTMSLKDLTHQNHTRAEAHPFTTRLVSGELSAEVYADYLYNQLPAYHKLETLCEQRGLLKNIETIKRSQAILDDFNELTPTYPISKIYPATIKYVDYLENLTNQQLLAHLYVRHMGDMYGGQMIKTKIPGNGSMYDFSDRKTLIQNLREKLSDDLAAEANHCFEQIFDLFTELANEHNIQ
jgi:heme oxygenase